MKLCLLACSLAAIAACGGIADAGPGDAAPDGRVVAQPPGVDGSTDAGPTPGDASSDGAPADVVAIDEGPPDGWVEGSPVATPTCSPLPGAYTYVQATLSDTTPDATIRYTTDGTNPGPKSAVYSTAITFTMSGQLRAYATVPGQPDSAVAACSYIVNPGPPLQEPAPVPQPTPGTLDNDTTVSLVEPGSPSIPPTICFTLDGSDPTIDPGGNCVSPTQTYDAAKQILLDGTVTGSPAVGQVVLKALAGAPTYLPGVMPAAQYTLRVATPTVTPASGKIVTGATVAFATDTKGAVTFHYTTDGTPASCASPRTGASFVTTGTEAKVDVVGCKPGYASSTDATAAYTF